MGIVEATILHHVCLVFLSLWLLSLYNLSHPFAYLVSLIYLYLVHERYAMRLGRKLRFEERKSCNQRRALTDSESARWLNYAVEKIWLVCMEGIVSQKILLPIIPWFLDKYKPWTVKSAIVRHLYMGRSPPMFTEMRILRQCPGDDHLVMEIGMNFRCADDMSAILAVKMKKRLGFGMKTKLHLNRMHVEGKVLVGVKFLSHWPFLGRLRVCFAEPPYFQITVKPMSARGLDVTEVPGIAGWLDKLLALAFEQTLVEPNMLVVNMEKFISPQQESWFFVDEKEPVAYALVEVIEATDMKPSDLNGLADPYVKGKIGQYRFRTKIQKKTLAPKWHEKFKVPICTWESLNSLIIEVCDKDRFVDDTLGDCSVNIIDFKSGQRHDMWLPLRNIKMGQLHLALTVVEDNRNDPDQPGNVEAMSDDDNENNNTSIKSAQEIFRSPEKLEISSKVADKFEAIDIEGQEETGIWVHQPGNEVSQIWEQRKGQKRVTDAKIICEGTESFDRSSVSGSLYNENSSNEGNNHGKKRNKIARGLKKMGLGIRSKKEEKNKEFIYSPRPNIKAINDRKIEVKLVVEENDVFTPCVVDGNGEESPEKKHEKEGRAKGIIRNAGHGVKNVFLRKRSNNSENDSDRASLEREEYLYDEESISSSVRTSFSVSGELKYGELNDEKTRKELAMNNEELTNKVDVHESIGGLESDNNAGV